MLLHRDALAGQCRLVNRRAPLHYNAVYRHALARPHHYNIIYYHFFDRNLHFSAISYDHRRLRRQIHQLADRIAGAPFGAGLQELAHGNQRQDRAGRFKVYIHAEIRNQLPVAVPHPVAHGKNGVYAVGHGSRRADRHQRIHIRGALCQAAEAHRKKLAVHIQNRQQQQKLGKRKGYRVFVAMQVLPYDARYRQAEPFEKHMVHRNIHQRDQTGKGHGQPFFHIGDLSLHRILAPSGRRIPPGRRQAPRRARPRTHRSAIACIRNRRNDRFVVQLCFVVFHRHRVCQQVHRRLLHARQPAHGFFHMGLAG